jgi:3',5'-cyclic AMP phosphodiesterase CpdA
VNFNKRIIDILVLCVVITALFIGCAGPPRSISSKYEILPEKPNGRSVSKRVLLVADNQLNHLYGDPFWLKNELFDKFIPVTIRPVQQDLFGQDILKWVLQYYGKKTPVIHLGDGTNMACIGEFESFCEIMDTAKKPWVMAPGNHDAYLMGNIHNLKKDWNDACLRANGPMTKDRFVREYLNHLKAQNDDFGKYLDNHPDQGEWRDTVSTETFLQAVAWKIDEKNPFRSFVLQELNLCIKGSDLPVYSILMDSTQYENAPTIPPTLTSYSAGLNGSMLSDQMDIAEKWLSNDSTGERLTVLMVHHPYASLIDSAGSTIDRFRAKYRIPLYVSGHTHHGEYFVRGGDNGWLELNVGSIVDWPIEFRTLEVHQIIDDPDNLVIRTPLSRIPDIWDNAISPRKPQCNPEEWEVKETDAKDFYLALNYKYSLNPEKTQKDLLVALLNTYSNLIIVVESAEDNTVWIEGCLSDQDVLNVIEDTEKNKNIDEMTSLLISLDNFDKKRKVKDKLMHRDYRLWQAIWASKYDKLNGRKPVTTDPYIRFPKRR